MDTKLTAKQELFCLYVLQGMTQHDAYLAAGYSKNMLPATVDEAASHMVADYKIRTRIQELRDRVSKVFILTVEERQQILSELAQRRDRLAVSAINELNKMTGDHAPDKVALLGRAEVEIAYTDRTKKDKDRLTPSPPAAT